MRGIEFFVGDGGSWQDGRKFWFGIVEPENHPCRILTCLLFAALPSSVVIFVRAAAGGAFFDAESSLTGDFASNEYRRREWVRLE